MTHRTCLPLVLGSPLAMLILAVGSPQGQAKQALPRPIRFHFDINPKTPIKDLLPTAPLSDERPLGKIVDDLEMVPEVRFQKWVHIAVGNGKEPEKEQKILFEAKQKALSDNAHQMAKINFLNGAKADRFMETLLEHRPDLTGLPFLFGGACRQKEQEKQAFVRAVSLTRSVLDDKFSAQSLSRQRDRMSEKTMDKTAWWPGDRVSIAAAMQILAIEFPEADQRDVPPAKFRLGLVRFLGDLPKTDENATRALVREAVFSVEPEIRRAALDVLKNRDSKPATEVLLQGLRYTWPSVAENACEAIVRLKRTDLAAELKKVLAEPDPRAPVQREAMGKKESVVRELVRVNHLRNCLLCHPPANAPDMIQEGRGGSDASFSCTAVTGAVPTPGEKVPAGPGGYDPFSSPDVLIRADVTYLRQDFSMLQKVPYAHPWPVLQRFDFLVRTRVLTDDEAKALRTEFERRRDTSPYRRAVEAALGRIEM